MYGGRQEKYADLAKRVEERLGVSTMSDQGSEEQVSLLLEPMLSLLLDPMLSLRLDPMLSLKKTLSSLSQESLSSPCRASPLSSRPSVLNPNRP